MKLSETRRGSCRQPLRNTRYLPWSIVCARSDPGRQQSAANVARLCPNSAASASRCSRNRRCTASEELWNSKPRSSLASLTSAITTRSSSKAGSPAFGTKRHLRPWPRSRNCVKYRHRHNPPYIDKHVREGSALAATESRQRFKARTRLAEADMAPPVGSPVKESEKTNCQSGQPAGSGPSGQAQGDDNRREKDTHKNREMRKGPTIDSTKTPI